MHVATLFLQGSEEDWPIKNEIHDFDFWYRFSKLIPLPFECWVEISKEGRNSPKKDFKSFKRILIPLFEVKYPYYSLGHQKFKEHVFLERVTFEVWFSFTKKQCVLLAGFFRGMWNLCL